MDGSTPGFPVSQSLLQLMSIESMMPKIHVYNRRIEIFVLIEEKKSYITPQPGENFY